MSAIVFKNLSKTYRKNGSSFNALNDVSLTVERGEFFGLLGPNGAGKTTLISILAGLNDACSGSVMVLGKNIKQHTSFVKSNIGIVPQELVFDPFFSVIETLQIQSGFFGLRNNQSWLEECLNALGLSERVNSNMRSLSGGMKRRVLIAQALVHKPSIIVLDEPTAGVDIDLRESLWDFVRKLNRDGHTIILTTHYLEEAEALCDRVAFLREGRLCAMKTTKELKLLDGGLKEYFRKINLREQHG